MVGVVGLSQEDEDKIRSAMAGSVVWLSQPPKFVLVALPALGHISFTHSYLIGGVRSVPMKLMDDSIVVQRKKVQFRWHFCELAFGKTVHKAQGATYRRVVLTLGSQMTFEQFLVAITRVREASHLRIIPPASIGDCWKTPLLSLAQNRAVNEWFGGVFDSDGHRQYDSDKVRRGKMAAPEKKMPRAEHESPGSPKVKQRKEAVVECEDSAEDEEVPWLPRFPVPDVLHNRSGMQRVLREVITKFSYISSEAIDSYVVDISSKIVGCAKLYRSGWILLAALGGHRAKAEELLGDRSKAVISWFSDGNHYITVAIDPLLSHISSYDSIGGRNVDATTNMRNAVGSLLFPAGYTEMACAPLRFQQESECAVMAANQIIYEIMGQDQRLTRSIFHDELRRIWGM